MTRFVLILGAALLALGLTPPAFASTAVENRAFKEAKSAFEDTIWDRAERQFAAFVEKYPASSLATEAVLFRAQALFQLGRSAEAIPILEERKANAGDQTDRYLYWIGEARFQGRDYAGAAGAFAELTRNYPSSTYRFESSVGEAEARARLGDWARVAELLGNPGGIFARAATNNTGSVWVIRGQFLLAQSGLERNEPVAALAALQSLNGAVLNADQTWQRQQLLTRIALNAGQAVEAEHLSTNLVLLAGLTARPELTAESWALRGLIFERLGQMPKAIEAYGQNLAATAPLERQREALGKLASLHLARGELAEAMRKLTGFLERSTNSFAAEVALLSLAELHLQQHLAADAATNHLDEALGLLDRLVTTAPESALLGQALLCRGWCYWVSNQPALSRAAFAAAAVRLEAPEARVVAQFKVGDAAFALKDYAAARDSYRAALATAEQAPARAGELRPRALYQLERACLALNDVTGAEAAMREILRQPPVPTLAASSLLLSAQGYTDAGQPLRAAELFAEFARVFPDSELQAEVTLAAARVAEQQGDWTGAVGRYAAWTARFTNHVRLPDALFYLARATARAQSETNAFGLFTNFVARFPAHALVPAAEYWLGDYFFRLGDFVGAEKRFSTLYHYHPGSELAAPACMMAGRAAIGRLGYREAITHFTNLTSNPQCPPDLKSPARFAYGSALRLLEESNPTNRIANLKIAAGVFSIIAQENPGTETAAAAAGELGSTYYQLGTLDPQYYPLALAAYQSITNLPAASAATRGLAGIGCGLVTEKLAPATGPDAISALQPAFDYYLNVLYDEAGDAFARSKAGLEALRVGGKLGEWRQVELLCERMQELFPALRSKLEKRRVEAAEKARVGPAPAAAEAAK